MCTQWEWDKQNVMHMQEAYNREQDLQRRLEATEKQLAVMQQQFDDFRRNPAGKQHTVEGATISLKVSGLPQQLPIY